MGALRPFQASCRGWGRWAHKKIHPGPPSGCGNLLFFPSTFSTTIENLRPFVARQVYTRATCCISSQVDVSFSNCELLSVLIYFFPSLHHHACQEAMG